MYICVCVFSISSATHMINNTTCSTDPMKEYMCSCAAKSLHADACILDNVMLAPNRSGVTV